jgi:hypothetical protein
VWEPPEEEVSDTTAAQPDTAAAQPDTATVRPDTTLSRLLRLRRGLPLPRPRR